MYDGKCAILLQAPIPSTVLNIERNLFERNLEDGMKKFVIEREIPKVGTLDGEQLKAAAAKSNAALRELGPEIQWVESYVAADKTFCVYLAEDEEIIQKHAALSGFPATKVTEIGSTIDPLTAAEEG
jgi:Protein of unknown function (DUF4242)